MWCITMATAWHIKGWWLCGCHSSCRDRTQAAQARFPRILFLSHKLAFPALPAWLKFFSAKLERRILARYSGVWTGQFWSNMIEQVNGLLFRAGVQQCHVPLMVLHGKNTFAATYIYSSGSCLNVREENFVQWLSVKLPTSFQVIELDWWGHSMDVHS